MDFFLNHIPASGSLLNSLAIVIGSLAGLALHSRLSQRYVAISFQGLGLLSLFLGLFMAQHTKNFLLMAVSIVAGGLAGEYLDLEARLNSMGEWIKGRIGSKNEKFTEAFMASSLLFCVGSMAILGALEQGLGGYPSLFVTKSLMDVTASAAMAASMGVGVLFSSVPVLLYQGGMTLLAGAARTIMTGPVIDEITAVGGLLLLGISLSILEIKKVKAVNMLPALLFAGVLSYFFL